MITVTIRANGVPRTVQAMGTQVIGEFLSANGIDTTRTSVYLNGNPINPSTAALTFDAAGIRESALISSVVKTANA